MRNIRIKLTGAGGTGKTTTAKLIAERLNLPFIPSVARAVFEAWGWTEERQRTATPEERWNLQKAIFDAKLEQESKIKEGVSDRSVLDHLVYTAYRCSDHMSRSILEAYEELTIENLQKDLVIFAPVYDWMPANDGVRENNRTYQFVQDLMFRGFLDKHHVTYFTLPNKSPEERATWAEKVVKAIWGEGVLL